jgi:hypothetical protein
MSPLLQTAAILSIRALRWVGGQGTRAIAALVFIGIAVPPLGALLKPYVTHAVFVLLCISFMRVDLAALRSYLRRPAIVLSATVWTTIGVPLITGLVSRVIGLDIHAVDLHLALMLQAAASPMMASPALAALMGLDTTLVLITLVTSTALVPFTAPLFAYAFFGDVLSLSPLGLGLKLVAILAGALLVAAAIRISFGASAIVRQKTAIDGFNILILLVFVAAVMGNVAGALLDDPLRVIALTVLAFAIFVTLLAVTLLIFLKAGRERALSLGLMVSQRNMGLMLAATEGVLPGTTWLYFALSQFPIYLAPNLLQPILRRLVAPPVATAPADA